MSRNLAAGTLAEVQAKGKRPVFFLEAEFISFTLRMWTGQGTISWNGQTWYGPGTGAAAPDGVTGSAVLSVQTATETTNVEAAGLQVKVSGLPGSLMTLVTDELRIGKIFNVWLGFMDAAGTTLVDTPAPWFQGWMDSADVKEDPGGAEITLNVENDLRRLQIPVTRLVTLNDQQTDFPTDALFKYVPGLKNWKGVWGGKQVQQAPTSTNGFNNTGNQPDRPRYFA